MVHSNLYSLFLSYSHTNEEKAVILIGILHKMLEIKTFINSCLEYYAANLSMKIDDSFYLKPSEETDKYSIRGYSTSHFDLILSSAINRMVNNCECNFLYSTIAFLKLCCHKD
jgi:hypothetical protein